MTHKSNIDSINGIKQTFFQMESFVQQKFEVTLLQQSLATVLNKYLPEWSLEIFGKGFGIDQATDTYRRHLILKDISGGTGKSTIARLLSFRLGFSNYISLESFSTERRRNPMIYFLSKFKRQVVIFDLVRAPFSKTDPNFIKKKVQDDIEKEFRILDDSQKDAKFLRKFLAPQKYKAQVMKAKRKILCVARLVSESRYAFTLGSIESEKMATFIEMFRQGCTTEERYFMRMSLIETPMKILIVNTDEYMKFLSRDYRENAYVIEITKEKCVPNKGKVKYYHLLNGFVENDILGHVFDGVSPAVVNLSNLGVCGDLLEISPEPLILTFGANDAEVDEDVLQEMNTVGGIGLKLID